MEMAAPNIVALRGIEVARGPDVRPAFRINPPLVLGVLLLASIALGAFDLVTLAAKSEIGSDQVRRIFNVDEEVSIPTWFSVLQLIAASLILGFIAIIRAVLHDRFAAHWGLLALVMLGLSLDEAAGIHEAGAQVLKTAGFGGEWVILGGLFAVAVAVFFARFLLALPRPIALLFVLAGAVMLAGAIGLESLHLTMWTRDPSFTGGLVPASEEFLERTGIAIMIYALLVYVTDHLGFRGIAVAPSAEYGR